MTSNGSDERREPKTAGWGPEEPAVEHIDKESERRELEDAGWVRIEREGKIVWRNPKSGHLYPQGAAVAVIRRGAAGGYASGGDNG